MRAEAKAPIANDVILAPGGNHNSGLPEFVSGIYDEASNHPMRLLGEVAVGGASKSNNAFAVPEVVAAAELRV